MQTQNITLDFCRNDYKTITVKQYDKDSRNVLITCTDNGSIYKLNSSTQECNVKMNTPDNRAIYNTATINEDGKVFITFDENMVHASGTGQLEIQIIERTTRRTLSSMILTVIIVGSVYPDDKIIASDEFNVLTEALLDIADSIKAMEEAQKIANDIKEFAETAIDDEKDRVNAEKARVSAENTRITAEDDRKTAENNRQIAETTRQTDTATAIENADKATKRANDAAEVCEDLVIIADVKKSGNVATISITDKNGTTTAKVNDGKDGTSATHSWNGTTLTISSASGTSSADLKGSKGDKGDPGYTPQKGTDYLDGKDGTSVTISKINESSADSGNNIVTFSDGKTLTIKNGSKGNTGLKGDKGDAGKTAYEYAKDGGYTNTEDKFAIKLARENPTIVMQSGAPEDTSAIWIDTDDEYDDGFSEAIQTALREAKASGEFDGKDGIDGKNGYTPIKGTDYFTDEEKAEMVNAVLTSLPVYSGEVI